MVLSLWQNSLFRNSLAISLGAIIGALSRYYLTILFANLLGTKFPFGTLFINITGSFFIGLFYTLTVSRILNLSPELISLIAVGFLGSYTTFSSYQLDSIGLFNEGYRQLTILYWLGSPILGFIAIKLGFMLGNFFLINT
jgi:CrcB protein